MASNNLNRGLTGKDLITVGIFSALYFVINFIFMLLGGLHPLIWILMPGFIALFSGIPFMLMCAKVQKPWAVLLMGIITGLIYFVTGQFTVVILVTFVISCALAELARAVTKYGSFAVFAWYDGIAASALADAGQLPFPDFLAGNPCGLP